MPDLDLSPFLAGFADPPAAANRLRRLASLPGAAGAADLALPHLAAALAHAASPDRALLNLERFIQATPDPGSFIQHLAADSHAADLLVTLFAGSQFLTEILLRAPQYYPHLLQYHALAQIKSPFQAYLEAYRAAYSSPRGREDVGGSADLDALRRHQRWELLRIGVCDLTGLLDLTSVTAQLSQLADSVIQVCLETLARELDAPAQGFVVLGMGKLGGGELNYSSDVDLLFLAAEEVAAYQRLAERLIGGLTQATSEGFLYRVDMRLRPWGRVGPLISSVDGYLTYLARHARLWERQALLRARVVAGDEAVGRDFLRRAEPLLFEAGPEAVRAEVRGMKELTEANLRLAGRTWGEVKLGAGSIRDAEFVAQYLQLAHGGDHPELRTGNTREALARLAEAGHLPADDQRTLAEGYTFLRTVEHYLQILDYRQTHTLPADPADLRYLARRLGFGGDDAGPAFVTRYQQHSTAIRAIYERHLGLTAENGAPTQRGVADMSTSHPAPADGASSLRDHVARLTPSYATTFSPQEIERHAGMAERLSDRNPVELAVERLADADWRVTIVAYDYLGELSVICGLLFAYGLSIMDGHVFTYEPGSGGGEAGRQGDKGQDTRRKIVDVFTVRLVAGGGGSADKTADVGALWRRYEADLGALLRLLQGRLQREAQGELVKYVALAVQGMPALTPALHPIDIVIDNDAAEDYTLLRIESPDTIGFLYEFANALTLNGIHIAQVTVTSAGNRVRDTLFVTDARGQKITSPERQRELRAATVLVKHFTHLLPQSPNPEAALTHFHEYLGELFARPSWPDDVASLERPAVLNALARLLGVSEFLWDDFLRMQYANLFPVVADVDALAAPKRKGELAAELDALLAAASNAEARRTALNAFKDREMFRIDMRDILGHQRDFGAFSAELTDLVEAVVTATADMVRRELAAQYGEPCDAEGRPIALSVCVLGKCGGFELGYASDIEVMFIYAGNGQTAGPRTLTGGEFFDKLVAEFNQAIWARRQGIFEIDLDLRPYGKAGSLAVSLDAFRRYFAAGGPAWPYERQALIKLRPIAGDLDLGRQVVALRDATVYSGAGFDVAAMRAMRERQLRHIVTPGAFNAKYSLGGLVDVEYVVQGLQMQHGAGQPGLRLTNTRAAIAALASYGILSAENAHRLHAAHLFLQQLINALRVVRGNSKDLTVPPEGSEEFAFLARRLGYGPDPARLAAALSDHTAWVQRLETRLVG